MCEGIICMSRVGKTNPRLHSSDNVNHCDLSACCGGFIGHTISGTYTCILITSFKEDHPFIKLQNIPYNNFRNINYYTSTMTIK